MSHRYSSRSSFGDEDRQDPVPRVSNQQETQRSSESPTAEPAPGTLGAVFECVSRRALQYERQIQDLEAKLTVDLSNSRAIENLLHEVFSGLQQTQHRADAALASTVPSVQHALEEDLDELRVLEHSLPIVGRQVHDIRNVYDRGRDKAQELVSALEWLNTPLSLRLRTIIFTSNAPVSTRWKALIRSLFAFAFLACMWIGWITLRGAVRAHRQRLVWGEHLMS
ncbi:hypothetical protein CERSUDRAFT_151674 [Gelatoporia subvermispora B]|uniref:Uncharacterized protein n=1 Tax=Ceriporiopsis subvermispora (strain B) TaxID=914234 RepID=M2RKE8_CERS8|nr:hypothetical protein CERSUDRAFT_151674 [Gelatoporia subvermispora B]